MNVAVVTGASRGIGAATAQRLAGDGYTVVAAARSGDALRALSGSGGRIVAVTADVGEETEVERVAEAATALGRLTVWVNNAAVIQQAPLRDMEYSAWRETLRVDLDAVFLGCRAALRRMAPGGDGLIVNLASLSGVANVEKFAGNAAYNVAKAGVIALSEAVALEGKRLGVRCVCLSPGAVDTELLRRAAPQLRAGVSAEDVAAIIAWLVTPAAAPLSGTNIPIFSNA